MRQTDGDKVMIFKTSRLVREVTSHTHTQEIVTPPSVHTLTLGSCDASVQNRSVLQDRRGESTHLQYMRRTARAPEKG